jgi:glycosyltransferase involved in cell wall biosynthesis
VTARPRIGIDARLAHRTGIGRYVRGLVNALLQVERDVTFVVLANPDGNDPTAVWDWLDGGQAKDEGRLEVVQFAKAVEAYTLAEQAWLPEVVRSKKLDLFHVPHWNAPVVGTTPLVVSIHDATYLTVAGAAPSRLKRAGARFVMKRVARKAGHVLVPSEAARTEVASTLGIDPAKTSVIPLFVDEVLDWVGRFRRGGCETISEPVKSLERFVLYVGHCLPHKDVPLVVRAFARVKKELGLTELVLALAGPRGRGTDAVEAAVTEAGVRDHVRFLGEVTERDLAYLYDRAAAFVTASRNEGFGLAACEAAAVGAPVIASDIPAHREVLREGALYFTPGDEKVCAGALARVLAVEAFARDLVKKGQARALSFRASETARATAAVYRAALSPVGGRA